MGQNLLGRTTYDTTRALLTKHPESTYMIITANSTHKKRYREAKGAVAVTRGSC